MKRWLLLLSLVPFCAGSFAQTNITILFNVVHANCGNTTGSITASVFGGSAPYTFYWEPSPPTGQGTTVLTDVPPGTYTLNATDGNGNTVSANTEVLLISGLFPDVTLAGAVWSCYASCDGSLYQQLPINGGGPYTTTIDPPGPTAFASPNGLYLNGLCPDESYMVTVENTSGCSGTIGPIDVVGEMAPELISLDVVGSCEGGATGSFTALFSAADSIFLVGPEPFYVVSNENPFTVEELPPGTYNCTVYRFEAPVASNSCSTSFDIVIPISTEPCGAVSGVVYADLDEDCALNGQDIGLPYRVLTFTPGDLNVLTNASGQYSTEFFYGDYAVNVNAPEYDPVCIALPVDVNLNATTPNAIVDMALHPQMGPDVSTHLSAGIHRPGFPVNYTITVSNEGPYQFTDLTLDLYYDPVLLLQENPDGTVMGPGHLQWSIPSMAGFGMLDLVVGLALPPTPSLTGVVMLSTATIAGAVDDSNPTNDSYSISSTVVNAYDPNDKLARTDHTNNDHIFFLDLDSYVDYTIRFQNTGTAEAINVYLLDTIAPEFDLSSLRILAASHAFEATLLPGHVLRFDFPNIMLPDSTSDLLGSQGFASFRLWPMPGMEPGQHLLNAADIFFDFNDPIRTNTSDLVAEFSVGLVEQSDGLALTYPNPVVDQLRLVLPEGVWKAQVLGMDGRVALRSPGIVNGSQMDLSALAAGTYALQLMNDEGMMLHTRVVKR